MCLKKPLPIKIMDNKRFFIRRSKQNIPVNRAEPNYRVQLNRDMTVTKKGKHFSSVPARIRPGVPLKEAKKAHIRKLLEVHSGENWEADPRYKFIKSVLISQAGGREGEEENDDDDDVCSCLAEDGFHDTV